MVVWQDMRWGLRGGVLAADMRIYVAFFAPEK